MSSERGLAGIIRDNLWTRRDDQPLLIQGFNQLPIGQNHGIPCDKSVDGLLKVAGGNRHKIAVFECFCRETHNCPFAKSINNLHTHPTWDKSRRRTGGLLGLHRLFRREERELPAVRTPPLNRTLERELTLSDLTLQPRIHDVPNFEPMSVEDDSNICN
jgi:hypothetical protein